MLELNLYASIHDIINGWCQGIQYKYDDIYYKHNGYFSGASIGYCYDMDKPYIIEYFSSDGLRRSSFWLYPDNCQVYSIEFYALDTLHGRQIDYQNNRHTIAWYSLGKKLNHRIR